MLNEQYLNDLHKTMLLVLCDPNVSKIDYTIAQANYYTALAAYAKQPKPQAIIATVVDTGKPVPVDVAGDSRTGSLSGLNVNDLERLIGFKANVKDDPSKVKYSWGFKVNGKRCAVWDYYGGWKRGEWSTFGPADVLTKLFGSAYKHIGGVDDND